jgi:hypothetical protein
MGTCSLACTDRRGVLALSSATGFARSCGLCVTGASAAWPWAAGRPSSGGCSMSGEQAVRHPTLD